MTSVTELYSIYKQYPSIVTDSRKIVPNCIFWAIKGENFDGNDFVETALKTGAAYAVSDSSNSDASNSCVLKVEDSLKAIQELAAHHIKALGIPVVAITGTNGKTTTKELTAACLSQKYRLGYTRGNFNNHLGVPLTILSFSADTEMALIEMGANHQYEIDVLCEIAQPDFGLITNIGKAHIEGFGSAEIIVETKTELYRYLQEKQGGIFLKADDKLLVEHAGNFCKSTYSLVDENADIFGKITDSNPFLNMQIRVTGSVAPIEIRSHLIGSYNAENILAAATVANHFGVHLQQIKNAVEAYRPQNNRSQYLETENNILILDAYNANPTSMRLALDTFSQMPGAYKTAIIGDMFELGDLSESEHLNILSYADGLRFDKLITVGKAFGRVSQNKTSRNHFQTVADLIGYLEENPITENLILLKASRGIGLEQVKHLL